MDEALQDIIGYGLVFVWVGGLFLLFSRSRLKQIEYLRRFPPVDGVWLDTFTGGNPFGRVAQAVRQVFREPQVDLELEQLRQESLRRGRLIPLWIFGFPVVTVGVITLLTVIGIVHPHWETKRIDKNGGWLGRNLLMRRLALLLDGGAGRSYTGLVRFFVE